MIVPRQMNGMISAELLQRSPNTSGTSGGAVAANTGKTRVATMAARRTVRRMIGAAFSPRARRLDIAGKPTVYSELNATDGSWKIRFVNVQTPSGTMPPTSPTVTFMPCSRPTNVNQLAWKLRPKRSNGPNERHPRSDGRPMRAVSRRVSTVEEPRARARPRRAPRRGAERDRDDGEHLKARLADEVDRQLPVVLHVAIEQDSPRRRHIVIGRDATMSAVTAPVRPNANAPPQIGPHSASASTSWIPFSVRSSCRVGGSGRRTIARAEPAVGERAADQQRGRTDCDDAEVLGREEPREGDAGDEPDDEVEQAGRREVEDAGQRPATNLFARKLERDADGFCRIDSGDGRPVQVVGYGLPPNVLISVVIPAHNAAPFIGAQLEALESQADGAPFEVVVVDNRSTDATRTKSKSSSIGWTCRWSRQTTEDRPPMRETSAFGTPAATSSCSSTRTTSASPTLLSAYRAHSSSYRIMGGAYEERLLNEPRVAAWRYELTARGLPVAFGKVPFFLMGNVAIERSVFDEVGYLDEALAHGGEEVDFSVRAYLAGIEIGWIPDAVVHYRHRTTLRGLADQFFDYGRATRYVYARYRERAALPPTTMKDVAHAAWAVLPHAVNFARGNRRRGDWVRYSSFYAGETVETFAQLRAKALRR